MLLWLHPKTNKDIDLKAFKLTMFLHMKKIYFQRFQIFITLHSAYQLCDLGDPFSYT